MHPGHDGHTSVLLGTAKYLSQHKNFSGTIHFIFQPAEEVLGGTKAMIDDGLFEKFASGRSLSTAQLARTSCRRSRCQ